MLQKVFEKNRNYIIAEYQNGKSTNKLAKEFNCNAGSIYFALQKWNIVIKKRSKFTGKVEQFDEQIINMHKEGLSANQISKNLNISDHTVLKRGNKLGLSFSDKNTWKNPIRLKDRVDEIISLYKSGLSANKIAKKLNYSQSQVSTLLNKQGFILSKSKYNVNLNFFDNIDNELKSYYLGMWYADGNVRPGQIRLQVADKEIILGAKRALNYSGPIRIIPPRVEGRKVQYNLGIARQELVKAITNKGCPPNKSLILTFPGIDIVPDNLIHHFIRGWFDGDGNLYYYEKKNKWKVQLVGTREFLEGVQNKINVTGYWSQRFPERNKNNWGFTLGKKSQIIKFLEFIYKGATVSLNRKKLLSDKCLADLRSR